MFDLASVLSELPALQSRAPWPGYEHVKGVAGALSSGDKADAEAKTQELLEAVQRFAKMR